MLFCGIYSKHATYDRSILAVDLEALVSTGKAHVRRTRDWRIPPGPPKFPLSELATQLSALRSGKNICELSTEEFQKGILELGTGKSTVRWMTAFANPGPDDSDFGEPAEGDFLDPSLDDVDDNDNDFQLLSNNDGDNVQPLPKDDASAVERC